jgi:hypothetical protein
LVLLERYGLEVVMAFIKDMVRMWLHAWKRFISIALISLLGVAVLTGIYAGCRDAFLATDRFFDTQGLHDIQVLSTAGLTDDDIAALRKISGVAPRLDELRIYSKTVYQTQYIYRDIHHKPKRWGVGLSAGYGFGKGGFGPVLAATVNYNLWNF